MSYNVDPNFIKQQQEVMRFHGLQGAKKATPGGKRDLKFLLLLLGGFAAVPVLLTLLLLLFGP